jgi:mono/diheme cytochrome c family protein
METIDTICFSRDILPIFQNSCGTTGCHNGSAEGFDARSYESIMKSVTPGDPEKSDAYKVLTNVYLGEKMPPDKPLSKEDRTLIALWIEQGAMNTDCNALPLNPGAENPNPDTICFAQDILPILQSSCAVTGCHDPVAREEDYDFSTFNSLMSDKEAIVPSNPNKSKVYKVITLSDENDRMPPPPMQRLTNAQIEAFRKWISQGAINSNCPSNECDTINAISFSQQVYPIFQRNCTGCHSASTNNGNVILTSYQDIKYYSENGRNNISFLHGVLNSVTGFTSMPPYGKLDHCSIRKIEKWMEQGSLNN